MRCAVVYLRRKEFVVDTSSRTTAGVWISAGPCERLELNATDRELAAAVIRALNMSTTNVAHPTNFQELLKPLLKTVNVRSWKAFAKKARCVEVEDSPSGGFRLIPTRNEDETFIPKTEDAIDCTEGGERLGEAIRAAFAISE